MMAVNFRDLCVLYNISITDFIQTTEPRHENSVTKLFGAIEKAGIFTRATMRAGTAGLARLFTRLRNSPVIKCAPCTG